MGVLFHDHMAPVTSDTKRGMLGKLEAATTTSEASAASNLHAATASCSMLSADSPQYATPEVSAFAEVASFSAVSEIFNSTRRSNSTGHK